VVKSIITNYLGQWVFVLLHFGLAILVWKRAQSIKEETGALQSWSPGRQGQTECTSVLSQFVDEAAHWGKFGILVPSTDFTDRLDSAVNGMMDGLSSLLNLFLVIGVAGTFVGLFEFTNAMSVSLLTSGNGAGSALKVADIGNALSSGLAKALPVSIVGIAATILGHVWASWIDRGLRKAVTEATQRAMYHRRQHSTSLAEAIRDAMNPFKEIAAAMNHQIGPVIAEFLGKVEESSRAMADRFEPFVEASLKFSDAAGGIKESISALRETTNSAQAFLRDTQKTRDNLAARTTKLFEKMEDLEGIMAKSASDLGDGAAQIREQSKEMAGAVRTSLGELRQSVSDIWASACADYFQALAPARDSLIEAAKSVSGAGSGLSGEFRTALQDVSRASIATWTEQTAQMLSLQDKRLAEFSKLSIDANRDFTQAAKQFRDASSYASAVTENGVGLVVKQLLKEYDSSLEQIKVFLREDVPPAIAALSVSGQEFRRLREESVVTIAKFNTSTQSSERALAALEDRMRLLSVDLGRIGESVRELNQTIATASEPVQPANGRDGVIGKWREWIPTLRRKR
jgi:ABC-type transporter Mla subunit MlaD